MKTLSAESLFGVHACLPTLPPLTPTPPPSIQEDQPPTSRHPVPPSSWWIRLHDHPPQPIIPATWNRRCPHCNALLLSTESDAFCCGNGKRVLPKLRPFPSRMQQVLSHATQCRHLSDFSRVVNNLFSFAGLESQGSSSTSPPGLDQDRQQLRSPVVHITWCGIPNIPTTPSIGFYMMKASGNSKPSNLAFMQQ